MNLDEKCKAQMYLRPHTLLSTSCIRQCLAWRVTKRNKTWSLHSGSSQLVQRVTIQKSECQVQVGVSDRERSTIWVTHMSLDLTVAMKPRELFF